eukprot:jgi/Mesvir1/22464/Mv18494-RA.1
MRMLTTAFLILACITSAIQPGHGRDLAAPHARKLLREVAHPISYPAGHLYTFSIDRNLRTIGRPGDPGLPAMADLPQGTLVTNVGAGGHSLAVSVDGTLFTWGRNDSKGGGGYGSQSVSDSGQSGRLRGDLRTPLPVEGELAGRPVVAAAAGRYHTVAAAKGGGVYTFGLNDWGQLGHPGVDYEGSSCWQGYSCRSALPQLVQGLETARAVAVAAGRYHSLAVLENGEVWSWGLNICGRSEKDAPRDGKHGAKPGLVKGFKGMKVVAVDAGYVHWAALTSDGLVYTCDTGFDGYAGFLPASVNRHRKGNAEGELGRAGDPFEPHPVELPLPAVAVATGRCFTLAALEDGGLFTWGCATLARPGSRTIPQRVLGPIANEVVTSVAGGEFTSAAVTLSGRAYVWGTTGKILQERRYALMGKTGAEAEIKGNGHEETPVPLVGLPPLEEGRAVHVRAGYQHLLIVVAPTHDDNKDSATGPQQHQHQSARHQGAQGGGSSGGAAQAGHSGNAGGGRAVAAASKAAPVVPVTMHARVPAEVERVEKGWKRVYQSTYQPLDAATIRAAAPDIFATLDESGGFDAGFKNPCYRQPGKGLRCVSYFNIIGVSKCGTTDLFKKLALLPQVVESLNKGPHFWDEPHAWDWYVDLFAPVAQAALADPPTIIAGDASSNTFTYSGVGIRGKPNGEVLLPELMYAVNPAERLILMVREPAARMYSAFWYYGCLYHIYDNFGMSPAGFHKFVEKEIGNFQECMDRHKSVRRCTREGFDASQQLIKGMYAAFLPDWVNVYPEDQLMVIRMEDYGRETELYLREVLAFLDIPEPSPDVWGKMLASPPTNQRGQRTQGCGAGAQDMLPETREMLREFYAPYNRQLAAMLADDRFLWED